MPNVRPFQGIRYATDDPADVTCPPYDIISKEQQDLLYERHPHNAVRLELARVDAPGPDRYATVADTFEKWLSEGVLKADGEPRLYVYRQDFKGPDGSRRRVAGVLGALELEPFGDSAGVLPHERTMPGPKEDRLALMNALPVNVSPLFAIYRGHGAIEPFLDSLENRPTTARFADDAGTLHRLWAIAAPAELEMLTGALEAGPLVIADGHHRYETALTYHEKRGDEPGDHGSVMCFCVDADSEGLVVLPYHRALKTSLDRSELRERLVEVGAQPIEASPQEWLDTSGADHPFAFLTSDEAIGIELSDQQVVEALGDRAVAWRALDVVALHEVLLPRVLGDAGAEFAFSRDPDEIARLVADGFTAGILLKGVAATDVVDVARSGERMPQKASYFWPKAITGLVFHSLR